MTHAFNPNRLETLRIKHRLTRSQFAKKVGVSRQIVHRWMTGKNLPTVGRVSRMAGAFGVPFDYFFVHTVNQRGGRRVN